jgi:hypothetical protein
LERRKPMRKKQKKASDRELLEQALGEIRIIREEVERIKREMVPVAVPYSPFIPWSPYPPVEPAPPWHPTTPGPIITWFSTTDANNKSYVLPLKF